jgi:hypothetical protein
VKLEYDGLRGRRVTAEWVAHPLGHLVFRHAATGRKIRNAEQPIMDRDRAADILRTIALDPGANATWIDPPKDSRNAFPATQSHEGVKS